MSNFLPLSHFVRQAMPAVKRADNAGIFTKNDGDYFRLNCAGIANKVWGEQVHNPGLSSFVNIAGLTISMRKRLTLHHVRAKVGQLVEQTDLHALPHEAPKLLSGAWLCEVNNPATEKLFGDTVSLGGYPLEDAIYLIGVTYPDGIFVVRWTPHWTGEDLESTLTPDRSLLIDDFDSHDAWGKEAARFAVVFALLLEAEGTPLHTKDEGNLLFKLKPKRKQIQPQKPSDVPWVTQHVYLAEAPKPSPEKASVSPAAANDRVSMTVEVSGHLKRQRYGPGNTLVKWIYRQSFEARRWVSGAPKRVVVH